MINLGHFQQLTKGYISYSQWGHWGYTTKNPSSTFSFVKPAIHL